MAVILAVLIAVAWKSILLLLDLFPFNADEAIVGLMARHILAGNVPTFFYGQAYMGSLDAIFVALFMAIFGSQVWVIRLVQVLLYATFVLLMARLARNLLGSNSGALAVALLAAVPTVNITLYTTVSLGGYNEALLIGVGLLLMLSQIETKGISWWRIFGLGFLTGLGVWAFGLTLVFTLPGLLGLLVILKRQRDHFPILRSLGLLLLGFILGSLPWLLWAFLNGPSLVIRELFGSAIAGASNGGLVRAWMLHLRNLLLFGPTVILGLRPPWSTEPLLPLFIPVVLIFWVGVAVLCWRWLKERSLSVTMAAALGSAVMLLTGFILTPFGADPSGRYFLPLIVPMTILAGAAFEFMKDRNKGRLAWVMVALLVVFHVGSTLQAANRGGDGLTTQFDPVARVDFSNFNELISFLKSEGIDRGYTNYWVAYPLAFRTGEELIFVPALPYHLDFRYTDRYNRYDPYNQLVDQSDQIAYITSNHPQLNKELRAAFNEEGVAFKLEEIGPFTIFYELSERVSPDQLGLPHQSGGGQ